MPFRPLQSNTQPQGNTISDIIKNYGTSVAQDFQKRGQDVISAVTTPQNPISAGIQTAGAVAGATGDIISEAIKPGINYLANKIADVPSFRKFATGSAGDVITNTQDKVVSAYQSWASQHPEAAKNLSSVLDIAAITVGNKAKLPESKLPLGEKPIMPEYPALPEVSNIVSEVKPVAPSPTSINIMNKVARLTPKQATKFEKLSGGKSHGEYLAETGNFGTPDQIIKNEATKFAQSLADKRATIEKLPGVYKEGAINDALDMLISKAKSESSPSVPSPYLKQVVDLKQKLNSTGLTMKEIEDTKALLERNVKLEYMRDMTKSAEVSKATNIDSTIRNWQTNQASKLGFTNLKDINKQTQLSKFIIDNLGDQVVGKSGLNNIGLSDWIILSGGDPTAVASFLTKRFFGSKAVQAKIAEMLNQSGVKGQITPEMMLTPENIQRQVSPTGALQLEAGKAGSPNVQVNVPIRQPSTRSIKQGTEIVPKSSKPK